MSRILPTTSIQRLCSPEWIAKSYSEYMLDCAQSQFNMINELTTAAADDELDEVIDDASDVYCTVTDNLVSIANQFSESESGVILCTSINDGFTLPILQTIIDNQEDYHDLYVEIGNNLEALAAQASTYSSEIDRVGTGDERIATFFDAVTKEVFITNSDDFISKKNAIIGDVMTNLHMGYNSPVLLDGGSVQLDELVTNIICNVNSLPTSNMTLKDLSGTTISTSFSLSSDDIFDQLKAAASSAIAWGFGFAAMSKDTMADKLAYFEAQIKSFISDTTESFASSVNVVRARIAEASDNINNFFDIAAEELGWNSLKNDTLLSVDETDVYSYTGASPLGSINTSLASKVATTVGKVVLGVGLGIFEGAKKLLSKAWNKVKPYVKAVTEDPVDIGLCDESDKSYTIANWMYHREHVTLYCSNKSTYDRDSQYQLEGILEDKYDKWISIDTFFGELQFCIHWVDSEYGGNNTTINMSYRFKPKCLNYRAMVKRGLVFKMAPQGVPTYNDKVVVGLTALDNTSLGRWVDFATSGELYPENDEDEKYVYMGYVFAIGLMDQLLRQTFWEVYDFQHDADPAKAWSVGDFANYPNASGVDVNLLQYHNPVFYYYTRQMVADTDDYWVPATVSNLDFLKIASGYYDDNGTNRFDIFMHNPDNVYSPIGNTAKGTLNSIVACAVYTFIMQQVDRNCFPSEYLYVPYYNNSYELSSGRYKIKTDADNANVANIIANAIIIIAVVLIVVFVAKTVLKIRKQRKIAKLTQTVGELDNQMWNGKRMNATQRWKYFRAKNKIAKLEGASSGLAGAGSTASRIYKAVGQVQSFVVSQDSEQGVSDKQSVNNAAQILKVITGKTM